MTDSNKGKLIVIEGPDGVGKDTQLDELVERLEKEGHTVSTFAFPQHNQPSARNVELYLDDQVMGDADKVHPYTGSIFYAEDRASVAKDISDAVKRGDIVICLRYRSANCGHQGGKILRDYIEPNHPTDSYDNVPEMDKFLEWTDFTEYDCLGLPRPDKTILLDAPVEIGQKNKQRQKSGNDDLKAVDGHEGNIDHLIYARHGFLYTGHRENWSIVDCENHSGNMELLPIDTIHEMIYNEVQPLLPQLD